MCGCPVARLLSLSQRVSQDFLLKGAAREHMMFVEGGDPLDVPVESLTTIPVSSPERREGEPLRAPSPAGGRYTEGGSPSVPTGPQPAPPPQNRRS